MNSKITVNGKEIKDAIVVIDTLNQTVSIETMWTGEQQLETNEIFAEVKLFGDIDITV